MTVVLLGTDQLLTVVTCPLSRIAVTMMCEWRHYLAAGLGAAFGIPYSLGLVRVLNEFAFYDLDSGKRSNSS
jgi:hypothetical protein